jgi:hypothetical protein
MAQLYPIYKTQTQQNGCNIMTGNVKAILVDGADVTYDPADEFLSAITAGGIEETSANMTGKTVTAGTFDADDVTFSATSGDNCEVVILYIDTGTAGTSTLVAFLNSSSISGLPVTLGGDVTIAWDAAGIFTL